MPPVQPEKGPLFLPNAREFSGQRAADQGREAARCAADPDYCKIVDTTFGTARVDTTLDGALPG
jgi:hypothetical protein